MDKYIDKCCKRFKSIPDLKDNVYEIANSIVEEEIIETKSKLRCKICSSTRISVESRQIRSADEAASIFVKCLQCGYTVKKSD